MSERLTFSKEFREANGLGEIEYLSPDELKAWDKKLASYEDLGTVEELAELVAAKQDNRLMVLPCKVGDRIYVRDDDGAIYNPRVQGISVAAHGNNTILHLGGYPVTNLWGDRKGIDWFLTREEAEAALKEQTNGTL